MSETRFKTKTADLIYKQMIMTPTSEVLETSDIIMQNIQALPTHNQLLGLASTLLYLLEHYRIDSTDVLSEAHNKVFSGEYNNVTPEFEVLKNYTKEKWELN